MYMYACALMHISHAHIHTHQPPKLSKADREKLKREEAERKAREEGTYTHVLSL